MARVNEPSEEGVAKKLVTFQHAQELVNPIVDKHGLEKYTLNAAFTTNAVYTPAEQHINLITNLADWLLEE